MPRGYSNPAPKANGRELICHRGLIRAQEPGRGPASVMAIKGRELVYVGSSLEEARAALSPRAELLDLGGRTVIPGLIDGHVHIFHQGLKLGQLDLAGRSKEEILKLTGRAAQERPAEEWIIGQGWSQEDWPDHHWPDRADLDRVAPAHPVVLYRTDKHSIWVNSRALELAGLNARTPVPAGGELLKTTDGRLSGILIGQAIWLVLNRMPPLDDQSRRQALRLAQAELLSHGVTSITEAGLTLAELAVLRKALQDDELKIRVRGFIWALGGHGEAWLASGGGLERGLYDERLDVAGIKIYADGALGSRSAWLNQDYADQPGHRGQGNYSSGQLTALLERLRDHELGAAVHAIGDAAVHQAVEAMAKVLNRRPFDHRWRLEHFLIAPERDLDQAARLGLVPSLQTVGLMSDLNMARKRLNPETLKRAYAWRTILDRRGLIVNGSDGPVDSVNPFEGLYAAVTRQSLEGRPPGGWRPEQKISREEALKSYTVWAAWSEFREDRKGSLRAGKLADFLVLDRDVMTCPEAEIKDIRVLKTFIGGRQVWPPTG